MGSLFTHILKFFPDLPKILKILDGDSSYTFRTLLKAGSGLVSNNVLHARSSFLDDETNKRHFYRSRYFDRLNGTSVLGD